MSTYKFSPAQRYAVMSTYGARCYICTEPIDLVTMQVDHIVPEKLIKDRDSLACVLRDYGLPSDFNLNTYENWSPACGRCNLQKRATQFKPTLMFQSHLERAGRLAPKARAHELETIKDKDIASALDVLARAGRLDASTIQRLERFVHSHQDIPGPVWITPPTPLQIRLGPDYIRTLIPSYLDEVGIAARLDVSGRTAIVLHPMSVGDVMAVRIVEDFWDAEHEEFVEAEQIHRDPLISALLFKILAKAAIEYPADRDSRIAVIFEMMESHGLPKVRHGEISAYLDQFSGSLKQALVEGMRAIFLGDHEEAEQAFTKAAREYATATDSNSIASVAAPSTATRTADAGPAAETALAAETSHAAEAKGVDD